MSAASSFLKPNFVKFIPKQLQPDYIYISIEYTTTSHLCACGCGQKVVLPLNPNDWSLTFNGRDITMRPSVGNWSFPCQSHYLITKGRVDWVGKWNDDQIKRGREADKSRRISEIAEANTSQLKDAPKLERKSMGFWQRLAHLMPFFR